MSAFSLVGTIGQSSGRIDSSWVSASIYSTVYLGEADSIYTANIRDLFGSALTEATSDVLTSELASCRELLELEPDNKCKQN